MNNVRATTRLNEEELQLGLAGTEKSWHARYAHSPHVFIGSLPFSMQTDDVLTVFEQVGRIRAVDMKKDKDTGTFRGFCFAEYEDERSAVLAVDNFNGVELYGRVIRVEHVLDYKPDPDQETTAATTPVLDVSNVVREVTHHLQLPQASDANLTREERVRQRLQARRMRAQAQDEVHSIQSTKAEGTKRGG